VGRGGRDRHRLRRHGLPHRPRPRGPAHRQGPGEQSGGGHEHRHGQPRGRFDLRLPKPVTDGQSARQRGTAPGPAFGFVVRNVPAFAFRITPTVEDALGETVHVALAHAVPVTFCVAVTLADGFSVALALCVGRRGLRAEYERSVRLQ